MITTILAIAFGGAIGSVARYGMNLYSEHLVGLKFPYGIFLANVIGSLAIGLCLHSLAVSSLAFLVVGLTS